MRPSLGSQWVSGLIVLFPLTTPSSESSLLSLTHTHWFAWHIHTSIHTYWQRVLGTLSCITRNVLQPWALVGLCVLGRALGSWDSLRILGI